MLMRCAIIFLGVSTASCSCACPPPCRVGTEPAALRPVERSDEPQLSGPLYDSALKAWTDEIEAAQRAATDCVYAATAESDPTVQSTKTSKCLEQYAQRLAENDARFERRKRELRGR